MAEKIKNKYTGQFNWHGQVMKKETTAASIAQARSFMFKKLADDLGIAPGSVKGYFDNHPNGYEIKMVSEGVIKPAQQTTTKKDYWWNRD